MPIDKFDDVVIIALYKKCYDRAKERERESGRERVGERKIMRERASESKLYTSGLYIVCIL